MLVAFDISIIKREIIYKKNIYVEKKYIIDKKEQFLLYEYF